MRVDSTGDQLGIVDATAMVDRVVAGRLVAPAFQPIVCLRRGEVAGFEALTRPDPRSGFAHPGALFDAATVAGRLWELESVTRAACLAQSADFPDGMLLFFNSSPSVFADPRFAGALTEVLASTGVAPSRLVLEITEASGDNHSEALVSQVRALRAKGFQIAVDDAGAGTSGLARILTLRPHWLKLDRALVAGVDRDRYQHNLVRILVHFARLSGVNLVAEGIERREELETLIDLGVDYAQGFYLAKPNAHYQILPEDVRELILSRRKRVRRSAGPMSGCRPEAGASIAALVSPVPRPQAGESLEAARRVLRERPEAEGLIVLDGQRVAGWSARTLVERPATPDLHAATRDAGPPLPVDETLTRALERMAARCGEEGPPAPLVVIDDHRVLGIVSAPVLMGAAARVVAVGSAGEASGLLSDLAALLLRHFGNDDEFLGHLGMDRFVLTADGTTMEARLRAALEEFDRAGAEIDRTATTGPAEMSAATVSLRALILPEAFTSNGNPRGVFVQQETLRRECDTPAIAGRIGQRSRVVVCGRKTG